MSPLLIELSCAPLLMVQGRHVRRVTPVLPPAEGPLSGIAGDGGPALRLLIAGDSSAAGVGVSSREQSMVGWLSQRLAAELRCQVHWRLLARSGLTAAQLLALLDEDPMGLRITPAPVEGDDRAFDAALMVVGVNDATGRRSAKAWLGDLQRLSECLGRAAPGAPQFWSGLPPMHRFPALPQPLRTYLGARARQLDRRLAGWAAASSVTRHLPIPDLQGAGVMASDGFHPGPVGYRHWGESLAGHLALGLRDRVVVDMR